MLISIPILAAVTVVATVLGDPHQGVQIIAQHVEKRARLPHLTSVGGESLERRMADGKSWQERRNEIQKSHERHKYDSHTAYVSGDGGRKNELQRLTDEAAKKMVAIYDEVGAKAFHGDLGTTGTTEGILAKGLHLMGHLKG